MSMSYSKRLLIFFVLLAVSAGALGAAFWLRTSSLFERVGEEQVLQGDSKDFFKSDITQPE